MLFCLGTVPKEDESRFLTSDDEDDDDDVEFYEEFQHQQQHKFVDQCKNHHCETNDNRINAGLLQAAVKADSESKSSSSASSSLCTVLRRHRRSTTTGRTSGGGGGGSLLRRSVTSHNNNHHHLHHTSKFVDTDVGNSNNGSNINNGTTTITSATVAPATTTTNTTPDGLSPTAAAVTTTPNATTRLLAKLGPAGLTRKLSQLRSGGHGSTGGQPTPKGTEHLQREALRKSNEAAANALLSKVVNENCQRYIRLPTSSCSSVLPVQNKSTSHQCGQKQQPSPPPPPPIPRGQSASSTSSATSSPSSGRSCLSSSSPVSPPSLVPRSANNPPPRPKTGKPLKNKSTTTTTTTLTSITTTMSTASRTKSTATGAPACSVVIAESPSSQPPPPLPPSAPVVQQQHQNGDQLSSSSSSSSTINNITLMSSSSATTTTTTPSWSSPSTASTTRQTSTISATFAAGSAAAAAASTPAATAAAASSNSTTTTTAATSSLHNNNTNNSTTSSANHGTSATANGSGTGSAAGGGSGHNHHHQHQQFINKPPRGWLHPDHKLTDSEQGVTYTVRYIGCLGVNTSMKSLDFQTRSLIAKESINRVCEAAGLKTADKKRRIDKRIAGMLADSPNMEHAGVDVNLSITISYLTLTLADTGEPLAKHEMPNISFASGGDTDTLDFAAYVAKDSRLERACFVLECEGGRAQEVITTIGQAFELRFNEFLKRNPMSSERLDTANHLNGISQSSSSSVPAQRIGDDREYYNDLPGKIPPDISNNNSSSLNGKIIPPLAAPRNTKNGVKSSVQVNLIDLNDDNNNNGNAVAVSCSKSTSTTNSGAPATTTTTSLLAKLLPPTDPQYVNCNSEMSPTTSTSMVVSSGAVTDKDPFDMQPFNNALAVHAAVEKSLIGNEFPPSTSSTSSTTNELPSSSSTVLNYDLSKEQWFHGPISRKDSEALVIRDGDFLVRESQAQTGQYVLTGMQGGSRKHLLLVDPEGVVRTKDKTFENVSHLINYHRNNGLPIISSESALVLKNPILTTTPKKLH